jgi:hypothetical protein
MGLGRPVRGKSVEVVIVIVADQFTVVGSHFISFCPWGPTQRVLIRARARWGFKKDNFLFFLPLWRKSKEEEEEDGPKVVIFTVRSPFLLILFSRSESEHLKLPVTRMINQYQQEDRACLFSLFGDPSEHFVARSTRGLGFCVTFVRDFWLILLLLGVQRLNESLLGEGFRGGFG